MKMRLGTIACGVGLLLASAVAPVAGVVAASAAGGVVPLLRLDSKRFAAPPTTAQCVADLGIACYSPNQFETAYDMKSLYAHGLTGRGKTIAIVDSFGSPTVKSDLATFDKAFGLPAPPKLTVIQPAGKVPAFDENNDDMVGWAEETSLDVQYAHAMAPGANILLVETPVSETEGLVGIPQIVTAENYVIKHHLADVISQSFGATEETFPSKQSLLEQRSAFFNAAAHHVSVLAASGDSGPTDYQADGENLYTHRVTGWPDSDPLVTAVGGTQLHLDADGHRIAPDNTWNDTVLLDSPAASGGGVSSVFRRPWYQHRVKGIVGSRRGVPDISLTAAVDGAALVYLGFGGVGGAGFYLIGGTSEATPMFAGVVAVADQAARHDLGLLNPRLYALAARHARGIPDITLGDNTVSFTQNGKSYTVPGFHARQGYDLATGLGTVDGANLVRELAR